MEADIMGFYRVWGLRVEIMKSSEGFWVHALGSRVL